MPPATGTPPACLMLGVWSGNFFCKQADSNHTLKNHRSNTGVSSSSEHLVQNLVVQQMLKITRWQGKGI